MYLVEPTTYIISTVSQLPYLPLFKHQAHSLKFNIKLLL